MQETPRNGTGSHRHSNAVDPEIVTDTAPAAPTLLPYHGPGPYQPTIVVRRDVAFGLVGIAVGIGLGIWFVNSCGGFRRGRD